MALKNQKLRKAIGAVLGTAAVLGVSQQAAATGASALTPAAFTAAGQNMLTPNYVWDGGNINTVGAPGSTGPMGPPIYGSVPGDSAGLGWNHTITWNLFEVTEAGGYTISVQRKATGNQLWNPAFTLFTSGGAQWDYASTLSHSFNQVVGPDLDYPARKAANDAAWAAYTSTPEYIAWEQGGYVGPAPPGSPGNVQPAGVGNSFAVDGGNTNDYMVPNGFTPYDDGNGNQVNGITDIVGYANSGPWFVNGDGNFVKGAQDQEATRTGTYYSSTNYIGTYNPAYDGREILNTITGTYNQHVAGGAPLLDGAGNPVPEWDAAHAGDVSAAYASAGSSVNTGNGLAELTVWLPKGWYVLGAAGSCYDVSCGTANGQSSLKVLPNASVSAPVPVPAAIWLFGSALAGFRALGRRKSTVR